MNEPNKIICTQCIGKLVCESKPEHERLRCPSFVQEQSDIQIAALELDKINYYP